LFSGVVHWVKNYSLYNSGDKRKWKSVIILHIFSLVEHQGFKVIALENENEIVFLTLITNELLYTWTYK
jgi:hypothetical protein